MSYHRSKKLMGKVKCKAFKMWYLNGADFSIRIVMERLRIGYDLARTWKKEWNEQNGK